MKSLTSTKLVSRGFKISLWDDFHKSVFSKSGLLEEERIIPEDQPYVCLILRIIYVFLRGEKHQEVHMKSGTSKTSRHRIKTRDFLHIRQYSKTLQTKQEHTFLKNISTRFLQMKYL